MSLHAHLAAVQVAEAKAQTRLAQLRRQTQTTRAAHEEAQRLLAALQRHPTSNPVEDEKAAELRQNAAVLNAKGNEYSDRISALEKDAVVPSDGRDLDSLAALQADIDKGLSVLKLKKDTLDAVQHLPPDMELARIKLAERKMQLASLIQKRDKILQSIMS